MQGYETALVKLLRPELLPFKGDVLLGAPRERLLDAQQATGSHDEGFGADLERQQANRQSRGRFGWPWQRAGQP